MIYETKMYSSKITFSGVPSSPNAGFFWGLIEGPIKLSTDKRRTARKILRKKDKHLLGILDGGT